MKETGIHSSERDWRYDALRVVMSFLVVLLHVSAQHIYGSDDAMPFLYNALGRQAVPAFFMVAGALSIPRSEAAGRTLWRMVRRVLLPLALAVVGYAALRWVTQGESFPAIIRMSISVPPYYHLSFMYRLATLYCLLPLLQAAWRGMSHRCRIAMPFALFLLIQLHLAGWYIHLPAEMNFLVYALMGAALDELLRGRQGLFRPAWWKALLLGAVAIACLMITGMQVRQASMEAGKLVERGWEYVMPLVAAAAVASFAAFRLMPGRVPEGPRRCLARVNAWTLGIYLWHPALILIMVGTWNIGGHIVSFPWQAGDPAAAIPAAAVVIWLMSGAAAALCGRIGRAMGRLTLTRKEGKHDARA